MLNALKSLLRRFGVDTRQVVQNAMSHSITAAIKHQGYAPLVEKLRACVPRIGDQYTAEFDSREFTRLWEPKLRGMHAFQVQCALDAMEHIKRDQMVIADVGDSSGNHAAYLQTLAPSGRLRQVISVNLDPVAVDKVKAKGGEAILCRAEELNQAGIEADLFMSFEMLEHLLNPAGFLHALATKGNAEWVLITVPYRRDSRFGGAHLRLAATGHDVPMTPESVHVHEFSPDDWTLMARFAGYRPVFTRLYHQYPRRFPWTLSAPLWRRLDFEGFLCLFLHRDLSLADRYSGW